MDDSKRSKTPLETREQHAVVASVRDARALVASRLAQQGGLRHYDDLPLTEAELNSLPPRQQVALYQDLPLFQRYQLIKKSYYPQQIVRATPPQELLYLVKEVGESDGFELLLMARPDQVQRVIDIDAYGPEGLHCATVMEYLDKLTTLDPERGVKLLVKLDRSLVVRAFLNSIKVLRKEWFEEQEDVDPDNYHTLDEVYRFEMVNPEADNDPAYRVLSWLFRFNPETYTWLMEALIYELPSDLDHHYRDERQGRLNDIGFPDFDFSLELLQREKPSAIEKKLASGRFAKDQGLANPRHQQGFLPVLYQVPGRQNGLSLLRQAMALLDEATRAIVHTELVHLTNRVLVARRFESEFELVGEGVRFAQSHLNLGLCHLCGDDPAKAARILRETALVGVFRLGYNLGLALRDEARHTRKDMDGLPRISREVDDAISGMVNDFPLFLDRLNPDGQGMNYRCLATGADLAAAWQVIHQARGFAAFVTKVLQLPGDYFATLPMGDYHPASLDELTAAHVFNTALVHRAIHERFDARGLDLDEVRRFARCMAEGQSLDQQREPLQFWLIAAIRDLPAEHRQALEDLVMKAYDVLAQEMSQACSGQEVDVRRLDTLIIRTAVSVS